jgi:hypothetical protein
VIPRLVLGVVALAALCPAPAGAERRALDQVSLGDLNGNQALPASWGGATPDGSRVYFTTSEQLVAEDTDNVSDVYERRGGRTTLISVPHTGISSAAGAAGFEGVSADGSAVAFSTSQRLAAEDTDGNGTDLYLRRNGETHVVSAPVGTDPFLSFGPRLAGLTSDGSRIFFFTIEDLVPEDDNGFQFDLYEWSDGTLRLVSVGEDGTSGGSGTSLAIGAVATDDGTRAFFFTRAALTAGDADSTGDVYAADFDPEASRWSTSLFTGGTAEDLTLRAIDHAGGERIVAETGEPVVAADTDTRQDVYEFSGDGVRILSVGPTAGSPPDFAADFQAASRDATRAFFTTSEHLVSADTDAVDDIYLRAGGRTTIESQGPVGGNADIADIVFAGVNPAGTRMYFTTSEQLTADDTDSGATDIYESHAATTRRVSLGEGTRDDLPDYAAFAGADPGGDRIIFQSNGQFTAADTDVTDDLYERANGRTRLLTGGTDDVDAIWRGRSDDVKHVWFTTPEPLGGFDADLQDDLFESRIDASPVVSLAGAALAYTAGDPAIAVDPALTVSDPDTGTLTGATVRIGTGFQPAEDELLFTAHGLITGSTNGPGDTLALSGPGSPAGYQAALRDVRYRTAATPGSRTVTVTVTDGADASDPVGRTIEVRSPPSSDLPGPDAPGPGPPGPGPSPVPDCMGEPATIVAKPGVPVTGTAGDDVIAGTSDDDVINARGGDDVVCSLGGDDEIHAGLGEDRIDAGPGDDYAHGRRDDDAIDGSGGDDRLRGGAGADDVNGSAGADFLDADLDDDFLDGGHGTDTVDGGRGDDLCVSGERRLACETGP